MRQGRGGASHSIRAAKEEPMIYEWTPNLTVGVREIDDQHKQLFRSIDQLLVALQQNRGKAESARIMDFLGEYVVEHFAAERQLMTRYRYPQLATHVVQHDQFVAAYAKLRADLDARGPTAALALKVTAQVGEWLRGHIKRADVELGKFILAATQVQQQR
jgi:hemerythrin